MRRRSARTRDPQVSGIDRAQPPSAPGKGTGHNDGYYLLQAACCLAGDGGTCLLLSVASLPRALVSLAKVPVMASWRDRLHRHQRLDPLTDLPRQLALAAIAHYQRAVSARRLRPVCAFRPSCSNYAAHAVQRYGLLMGGTKAAGRLLRCRPGTGGGQDPLL